jgi:hypothetical protein
VGKRGSICDYAGDEIHKDDLVAYSARVGNRTRMTDAIVLEVTTKIAPVEGVGNVLVAVLKVQPTGIDSGWGLGARRSLAPQWITAEHVRLLRTNAEIRRSSGEAGRG